MLAWDFSHHDDWPWCFGRETRGLPETNFCTLTGEMPHHIPNAQSQMFAGPENWATPLGIVLL